jgi:hypothetical protein
VEHRQQRRCVSPEIRWPETIAKRNVIVGSYCE